MAIFDLHEKGRLILTGFLTLAHVTNNIEIRGERGTQNENANNEKREGRLFLTTPVLTHTTDLAYKPNTKATTEPTTKPTIKFITKQTCSHLQLALLLHAATNPPTKPITKPAAETTTKTYYHSS